MRRNCHSSVCVYIYTHMHTHKWLQEFGVYFFTFTFEGLDWKTYYNPVWRMTYLHFFFEIPLKVLSTRLTKCLFVWLRYSLTGTLWHAVNTHSSNRGSSKIKQISLNPLLLIIQAASHYESIHAHQMCHSIGSTVAIWTKGSADYVTGSVLSWLDKDFGL